VTNTPLRAGNTVDAVYAILHERIIAGTYRPGSKLPQQAIAAELKISRTPLREALRRLESDGLLIFTANRGTEVAPIAFSDTEEHYAIRLLVEPAMLAAITDRFSPTDLNRMEKFLTAMERTVPRTRDFQRAHAEFHGIALLHYPDYIRGLIHRMHTVIHRHQQVYLSAPARPEDFLVADRMLLAALRSRDANRARQVLEFHLLDAAVGLVLDADPDHRFAALLLAARGQGIDIAHDRLSRMQRPVPVRWMRHGTAEGLALSSANLQQQTTTPQARRR
jgi:DNA-binding GntR family transcriptional regulator